MGPTIGVATDRSKTPSRTDAVVVGRQSRVIGLATVRRKSAAAKARAALETIVGRAEPMLAEPVESAEQVLEHLDTALQAASFKFATGHEPGAALLLAYVGLEHVALVASSKVRCYRFRSGMLTDVTPSDDSMELSFNVEGVAEGDCFVLCTEGVFGAVGEPRIAQALRDEYHPRLVAWTLVEAARSARVDHDATAVVIRPM